MERNVFSGKMAKIVDALVSSGESPFDKLMPFFEFINENVITLYGNESPFLYSALPIWSYMQGKFVERYPLKSRDATSLDQYTRLYDILNEMGFSFAGFLSHCIKRIPPCLEIKFFQGDRHLEIGSTGLVVTLAFPIKQPILDKLKNSGWRNSYDVEENFVQNEFETFSEEIKKIAPILEVVTQSSSRELYWGFFKFLYAYAHVFSGPAIKSLYIVPAKVYKTKEKFDIGYGCLIMASDRECPFDFEGGDKTVKALSLLMNIIFSSWAIYDWADFRYFKDALTSTKAAIGAIMARNGSHNIGSHVLAALSHNVGTMPDDRVLYQYIQHRMDYIATATTELPVWNQPLSFVGNLVRTFLMQRHLLDYITGSEGLKAYQFQNRTVDTMNEGCQPNTIRLHVRRVGDDDSGWTEENNYSVEESKAQNFIPYPECPVSENALLHDLEVAIPGGIVGQHAFFTILENILRNAAKHEWAKLKKDEKERAKRKYLDVHVDFKDNPEEGIVEVVAWTDNEYGRIHYGKDAYAGKSKSLSPLEIEEYLSKDKDDEGLDLSGLDADHKKLQVRMARSFIGTSGGLRKENWGLAEMRISAGYLNTAGISEIGGLDKKQSSELNLIKPIMVLNGDHYCLGYHFHMPKPRELLIVIPQEITIDAKDVLAANRKLKRHGVAVIAEEDVRNESSKRERSSRLSYAYVLLKEFRKLDEDVEDGQFHDMRKWKLPFRVITASAEVLRPSAAAGFDRRADFASERKDFFEENVFKAWIAKVSGSDESAKTESEQLLFDIYRSWAHHLKKEKKLEKIPISIDLKGSDSNARGGSSGASSDSGGNAEKSLISDVDLLWVVFGHCFNTAVDSYLKTSVRAGKELKTILKEMQSLSPREIGFSVVAKGRNLSLDEMIRDQLRNWCGQIKDHESATRFSQYLTDIDDTPSGDWDYLNIPAGLIEFVNYLATTILGQAKVFLSKYEEHYSTLPIALVPKTEDNVEQKIGKLDNQDILSTVPEKDKIKLLKEKGEPVHMGESEIIQSNVLAYWRHEDACCTRTEELTDASGKKIRIPIQATYLEPLSGSQSYINSFSLLTRGDELQRARFTVKLIETGLVKVLIVDERLKKFEQDHSEVKCTFAKIGVAALGEDSEAVDKLFAISDSREKVLSDIAIKDYGTKVGDYDILVIHQGIIDKKIHNHSDSEMINSFVNRLKQEIRYVVVTTGRGTPANIPGNVRVLPFSVVESTLFKKYPEKLVLVDAIMNILPSGGKETP